MQLLIDTHISIWFLEGNKLLAKSRRQIIANSNNEIFISIASIWEIAIKNQHRQINARQAAC
ncbi:MAG: type II toxin-antitoxin system VapC family toxin [Pyrinomonadaceae bacterium]